MIIGSHSFQFSEGTTIDIESCESYFSHAVFPVFKLSKVKDTIGIGSAWTIEMAVSENFLNFKYPHIFSDTTIFSRTYQALTILPNLFFLLCSQIQDFSSINITQFL